MMTTQQEKALPIPTGETQPFWEGCRNHDLRIQQCRACGHYQFYPRLYCTACMSEHVVWVRVSGRGTVLSFTVVYRPVTKAFVEDVPYVVALVTLEEGPQLMSNIVECEPEQVAIGMPVESVFEDWSEEIAVLKFRPVLASR